MTEYLDLVMFAALMAAILMGFPVAFSIAGVAILFAYLGWVLGVMDVSLLGALGQRAFGLLSNQVLIAIPLFVLMGAILEKSRIAEELLDTMGRLFGQLKGGLGISVVLVGALLAASTGIVGATVVAMGMIALPAMLRAGYDPRVASGIVCTAGTLGQIIPPSTLLIILADVMSNAFQQAQYEQGKFSVEALSVGQFFAAALVPGLVLVVLYLLYILVRGFLRPQDMPSAPAEMARPSRGEVVRAVVPPILLIFAVLGAILGGVATPTEAASVGAIGALLMAGLRAGGPVRLILMGAAALILLGILSGVHPIRLQRSDLSTGDFAAGLFYALLTAAGAIAVIAALRSGLKKRILHEAVTSTATMTAMIFATILAAGMFSLVFIGLGGEERVAHILGNMPGGPSGALLFCMLFIFVLGFFLDFVEISVIVLPLVTPTLILMGHDPVWLGILIAINLQTSFLTPPFGFSLFYLRGAAPEEVTTRHIYQGVVPFIGLQALGVLLVWLIPGLATWLPAAIF
ncbi:MULTISPECIES: TRAP transporter large permease [Leisingera]|jgi:TRAP-type mannitol/chloroaromatic compound transport system permease large subunit|uniref:TRAP transporter large permease subunit n=1 Tax=Leisingera aquaemixtae TaxID=1396826 RepID=A0ABY5WHG2_9RHOB|nr:MULTISPECIES: TRAP transporter large permease subunit [Leisingera]QDI74572.1 TRAP transporter large permease subunit [Leisingera aquaemixtae]UWQ24301.1 TRAP transporter large permease subunit [Leisingera aquaemixtae]UWQ40937.1 TRAP transporter large permease subunit [Leisingera aquaemixtae]UWQ45207.1 TRAP transporter large permease subunit [Leisingera aquaemixtae]